jgi:hypothetical protein
MSDGPDQDPPAEDPFLAEDPEAYERERRRLQREAKRRERSGRKSLASRVSGAIDGATDKGREAIEQTRERVSHSDASGDGAEPPSFRRPAPEAPADPDAPLVPPVGQEPDPGRIPADVLMPRRPGRRTADVGAVPPAPPPPPSVEPAAPLTEDHDWFTDADDSPPPEVPAERKAFATGDYPPLPPHSTPPPGARRGIMIRRGIAIGVLVILAIIAFVFLSNRGGGDPAPAGQGPKTLKTQDLTIPEGYTRSQIAEVAKDAGLKGDYEKETAMAPKGFDIEKEGAPADASLEGFLFPSTYELEKGAKVSTLIDDQLSAFNSNLAQVDLKQAEKKNLTIYDVVIIASMIEREVLVPEERPIVAAVIYNRLSQGIPLGIDATLRYDLDNFDQALTESDLATDSPYNTRLNQGLPPTPIANPGLDSLKAAANPSNDDYLYYVGKYGTCGEHFFTADYDEFLAASDEYNAALEAETGPPTDC